MLYIDSRKDLNKTLKGLSELKITREDLLDNHEAAGRIESSELGAPLPDTTTPDASPQKIVPPPIKKKQLASYIIIHIYTYIVNVLAIMFRHHVQYWGISATSYI